MLLSFSITLKTFSFPHDNAVVENFFKREFTSMEEIKMELIYYIKYYNNDRIKQSLNWLSPVIYRKTVA